MATKKQRRRRAKEHRHEYVWVDEEGNELDREEVPTAKQGAQGRSASVRTAREPDAPSWKRTLRRALIFAPIMFATVFILSPDLPLLTKITQTLFIVAIFVPFSYFLDRVFYRSFQRRQSKREHARGGRGS